MQDTKGLTIEEHLKAARLSLFIAELVTEQRVFPLRAAFEIALAWRELAQAWASIANNTSPENQRVLEAIDALPTHLLPLTAELNRSRWREDLQRFLSLTEGDFLKQSTDTEYYFEHLEEHNHVLRGALRKIDKSRPRSFRAKAFLIGVFLIAIFSGLFLYRTRDHGPWQVLYYDNAELSGEPARFGKGTQIDFDWTWVGPLSGFPADNYSIRWKSIINLPQPKTIRFELASDDGSRLIIDGRTEIDQWYAHPFQPNEITLELAAGSHTIEVDYFQLSASAEIRLRADLGDGELRQIPEALLSYPRR